MPDQPACQYCHASEDIVYGAASGAWFCRDSGPCVQRMVARAAESARYEAFGRACEPLLEVLRPFVLRTYQGDIDDALGLLKERTNG